MSTTYRCPRCDHHVTLRVTPTFLPTCSCGTVIENGRVKGRLAPIQMNPEPQEAHK